ncbi:outer membrane porin, OprD family [Pseudomonas daroniae]|uniref:Outer membrane porin, OprD family n=1 Tax=Phytopseudomonas daroniae TaxID=2487519 RepID=A0A4Q9QQD6_9GAMM|nr:MULTISPECIES: OprD family porin [Pseudomonas]TBU82898.1 outer membrane porin, OprD family [Pseudomonas daroniae]TBU85902.1 outer membrane porin, OprD family [Pseudomonas sp. FRB 228]TBU95065.1 outer membrane porin, OprD family [Pseudomonas daroniae]
MSRLHRVFAGCLAGGLSVAVQAEEAGFIEGSHADLQLRNYFFSRDYSGIVGSNPQSRTQEWAQGFIFDFRSGYTQGPVGFGVDVLGLYGIKLDSGRGHTSSGLLPVHDGRAADEYGRLGAALKARVSRTELKVGELRPHLPVLFHSDLRLLPPTYQGAALVSNEIQGLMLQAGQMRSTSLRDSTDRQAMYGLINDPVNPARIARFTSDRFNYLGADYAFNANRTSVGLWQAQLQDIYQQRFYSFKHAEPIGDWTLGLNAGYFDSRDEGRSIAGKLDNQATFALFSARHGGHTFYLGYQRIDGDDGFIQVGANTNPMGNTLPTYEFAAPGERSWQVRHDYDFAVLGIPGLTSTLRYVSGDNVRTGQGYEGKDWERDLDLAYVVQSGLLKGVGLRWRNVTARSNYRTDIDENRLILSYTLSLF